MVVCPLRVVAAAVKDVVRLFDEYEVAEGRAGARRLARKPGVVALPYSVLGLTTLHENLRLDHALLVGHDPL